jgi:hypothetical protein
MRRTKALRELDLRYARLMGKKALIEKMRYHARQIKEHQEEKNDVLALIIMLNEKGE